MYLTLSAPRGPIEVKRPFRVTCTKGFFYNDRSRGCRSASRPAATQRRLATLVKIFVCGILAPALSPSGGNRRKLCRKLIPPTCPMVQYQIQRERTNTRMSLRRIEHMDKKNRG